MRISIFASCLCEEPPSTASKPDSCGPLLLSALNILSAPKTVREQGPREDGGGRAGFSQMRNRFMFGAGKQERSHEVASALTSRRRPLGARFSATPPQENFLRINLPEVNFVYPRGERACSFLRRRSLSVMNSSESRALGTLNIKRGHSSLYLVIARVKPADGSVALMHRASPSRH